MKSSWPGKTGRYGLPKEPLAAITPGADSTVPSASSTAKAPRRPHRGDGGAGADLGVQAGGVTLQVGDDLIAVRIAVRITVEARAGQGAVAGRGEQGQAVVVGGPGPRGKLASLQHQRAQPGPEQGAGGGQTGLTGADDDDIESGSTHAAASYRQI
nr:hypothetical protein GCM10020093_020680 [Planobispora longispora]